MTPHDGPERQFPSASSRPASFRSKILRRAREQPWPSAQKPGRPGGHTRRLLPSSAPSGTDPARKPVRIPKLPYEGAPLWGRRRPSRYARIRLMCGARADVVPGPAHLHAIQVMLERSRPEKCSMPTIRRLAVMAILVATGRLEWTLRLRGADVLQGMKLPASAWRWVAKWLYFRWGFLGHRDVESWASAMPLYGCNTGNVGAGVAQAFAKAGWPAWRAGQVARAGVRSRPWRPQETKRNNGPRCWPPEYEPVTFAEWAGTRVGRGSMEWITKLFPLAGLAPRKVAAPGP